MIVYSLKLNKKLINNLLYKYMPGYIICIAELHKIQELY